MKKCLLLTVTTLLFSVAATFGQKMGEGDGKVDIGAIKKKMEQSNADIQDPSKNGKWSTWLTRGDVFLEAAIAPTKGLYNSLPESELGKLYPGGFKDREPVTLGGTKFKVKENDRFVVYVVDSGKKEERKVSMWEEKFVLDSMALDIAADAYDKAFALDMKAAERAYKGMDEIVKMVKNNAAMAQRLGQYGKAAREYRRSYILQTYPAYAVLRKVDIVVDSTDLFYAAMNFAGSQDFVSALECLRELVSMQYCDKDGDIYYYLYNSYRGVDKEDSARMYLLEGARKFPQASRLYSSLPIIYLIDGDADITEIEPIMQKAFENKEEKDKGRLYFLMGQAYYKRKMDDKALDYYIKASKEDPDDFSIQYSIAQIYMIKAADKVQELQEVSENLPKDEYDKAKEGVYDFYKKAIPYLEKAHKLDPKHPTVVELLADLTFRLRDTSDEMMEKSKKYGDLNKAMKAEQGGGEEQ